MKYEKGNKQPFRTIYTLVMVIIFKVGTFVLYMTKLASGHESTAYSQLRLLKTLVQSHLDFNSEYTFSVSFLAFFLSSASLNRS